MTVLKVLGKSSFPHKYSHGLLFMVGLSALGIHSCDSKPCSPKNVYASRKSCHLKLSVTYALR